MEFKEEVNNGTCEAHVEGELTIYHVNEFKESLLKAIKKSTCLKLDLSAVSEIDTSCMQLLMQAQDSCDENEKEFEVTAISPAVMEIMEIFGLETYFNSASAA